MEEKLTQEELKRQLHYSPETGLFTRLISNSRNVKIGDIAGCLDKNGYIRIAVNGKGYYAHQLANLYMEGYFPEYQMDHKLGIRDDNRWSEIRHVTPSCNLQNQKISSNNTSGFPGVYKHGNKWGGMIKVNGKLIRIGLYNDRLNAALARFTFEMQCPDWSCNYRSELVKAIKSAWPQFKFGKRRRTKNKS